MDLLFFFICFLLLISFRLERHGTPRKELLDVEKTEKLRGILAILIIMNHMSEKTSGGRFFPLFVHVGYLIVTVFFFLSGFGLTVQFQKRRDTYLRGFLRSRVLPIALEYFVITAVYAFVKWGLGEEMSVLKVLASFVNGKPVATNSWYMLIQILLYLIFWLVFLLLKNNENAAVWAVFALETVLAAFLWLFGYPSIWFISNFGFVLGIVWAEKRDKLFALNGWCYGFSLLLSLGIFAVFSAVPLVAPAPESWAGSLEIICRMVSTTAFAAALALALQKIRLVGKPWEFLGSVSLEIYLLHGMVYTVLRSKWIYIESDVLWTVLTVIVSVALAWPTHLLFSKLTGLLRKQAQREKC